MWDHYILWHNRNVPVSIQAGCNEPSECFQPVFSWEIWRKVFCEASASGVLCVCVLSHIFCLFLNGVTHPLTQKLFVSLVFSSIRSLLFSFFLLYFGGVNHQYGLVQWKTKTNKQRNRRTTEAQIIHGNLKMMGSFFICLSLVSNSDPDGVSWSSG